MSDEINLFVSNGTCYSAPNEEASKKMIPCGNDANQHAACCQAGDNCLESSVCYNGDFGVTYIAGCSDPSFMDPSCVNKLTYLEGRDRDNSPWLGLAYCNDTTNLWVMCDQKKKPATLTKPDACWCTFGPNFALAQSSVIPGTASLPSTILGSIQFSVGYYPTPKPSFGSGVITTAADPTATDGSSAAQSISSPAQTTESTTATDLAAPTDPTNEPGLSPSPSAKTGAIAGGAAGAFLLILLLAGALCLRRQKKKKRLQRQEEDRAVENFMNEGVINKVATEADPLNLGLGLGTIAAGGGGGGGGGGPPDTPALSELDSKAARPWSLRSELDNNSSSRGPSARSSYNTAATSHGLGDAGGQARRAPSELAAHPIAELPG